MVTLVKFTAASRGEKDRYASPLLTVFELLTKKLSSDQNLFLIKTPRSEITII